MVEKQGKKGERKSPARYKGQAQGKYILQPHCFTFSVKEILILIFFRQLDPSWIDSSGPLPSQDDRSPILALVCLSERDQN